MTQMEDRVFAVRGSSLPTDYRFGLWRALCAELPWMEQEPAAGVVGVRLTPTGGPMSLLSRRATMTLRLPLARIEDAAQLEGTRVKVEAETLEIAQSHGKPLAASATLHAQLVSLGIEDEVEFDRRLKEELGCLQVACGVILGRRRRLRAGEREVSGFPVVLHGCSAENSLRLQRIGIGELRGIGLGIFIPHKRIEGIG